MDTEKSLLIKVNSHIQDQENLPYVPLLEYNIFNILGIQAKEVVMCRFLADLLNPEGMHGYGILFLKTFLRDVLVLNESRINDTLLDYTNVIQEYVIDNARRIDIVIQNARFFLPIEVKIHAGEQEGQCYDYYEYAKEIDENTKIIYLTKYGDIPSEFSRKEKNSTEILPLDKIKCISWEKDICGWLTGLLPQLSEPIKSIVMQFIDAIYSIVDRSENTLMQKTLEILFESPDYFNAGIQIEKSMKDAKLKLIRLVFDDFKKEMDKIAPEYGLELEKDALYFTYDEKRHEKYYDGNNRTCPGLNYVVKNAKFQKSNLQMWFRIEVDDNLFAGFCLFDMEAEPQYANLKGCEVDDIPTELIDEAAKYLNRDIYDPSAWWFTWCYSNGKHQEDNYADVPNFREMNQCAINLVDSQKRKDFVKNSVKSFEKHLLKYLLKVRSE